MNAWRPIVLVLLVSVAISAVANAQTTLRAPSDLLTRVGFDQRLGARVPLDLTFRDGSGTPVRLRDALDGRPALLVLGYYRCANLCDAVRAGVAAAVGRSGLTPGTQFNVLLVSIDPQETPADAADAQGLDAAAHPHANVGHWRYLTGARATSAALADAIGFRYFWDPRNRQYAHAAGLVTLSAQGTITQYLFGVQFVPQTLRLALVSASGGHIGTLVDRFVLLCCDYDPSTGRYSLLVTRVMQGLGIATVLALGGLIVILRHAERRHSTPERP